MSKKVNLSGNFLQFLVLCFLIISLTLVVIFSRNSTNISSRAKEYRTFRHALLLENTAENVPQPDTPSYIEFDGTPFLPKKGYTAEVWIRPLYPEFPGKYVFSYQDSNPGLALLVSSYKNSAGTYDMNFQAFVGDDTGTCNPKSVILNRKGLSSYEVIKWTHAALTVDDQGVVNLFVNGVVSENSNQISNVCSPDTRFLLAAGGAEPVAFFSGEIDELRISSTARYSDSFIPSLYPYSPDSSTLALIKFDKSLADSTNPYLVGVPYGQYSFVTSTVNK